MAVAAVLCLLFSFNEEFASLPSPSHLRTTGTSYPTVRYESNEGQASRRFDYIARAGALTAGLRASGFDVFTSSGPKRLLFLGADPDASSSAYNEFPLTTSYIRGADRIGWVTGVKSFASVRYESVYQGVDVVYRDGGGASEFDFLLDPEASPDQIAIRYRDGRIALTEHGSLRVDMPGPDLLLRAPIAFQPGDPTSEVEVRFRRLDRSTFGFLVGDYDRSLPLVIDPVITYATYVGGTAFDVPAAMDVDSQGHIYITGRTTSVDVPVSAPIAGSKPGKDDIFLLKLTSDGSDPTSAIFLGGSEVDVPFDLTVGRSDRAYVTGMTCSEDFPVTRGVFQPRKAGGCDSFLVKLAPDGETLAYSSFLGGAGLDQAQSIAVDDSGAAYLVGEADTERRVRGGFQESYAGGERDAFVAKVAPGAKELDYFSFLGGRGDDRGRGIALDDADAAVVTGITNSSDFPVRNALQQRKSGPASVADPAAADAFIAKVAPDGRSLKWSTFLGGSDFDSGYAIDIREGNQIYVGGGTASRDFPSRKALQPSFGGGNDGDGFVVKLRRDGAALLYATYLGGGGFDRVLGIDVDATGEAFVAGRTNSEDIELLDAVQPRYGGGVADALVARIASDGSALRFLTYFGGSAYDRAYSVVNDPEGTLKVAGETTSSDLRVERPLQEDYAGQTDGFLMDILMCDCS